MTTPLPDPNRPSPVHATREAFASALRDFINLELPKLHAKAPANPNVAFDTPLFVSGLIDSMAILHLIGFVERATGRDIPPQQVVMKHFQTVAVIADTFWP